MWMTLRDSCVWLRSLWEHFTTLFEGTELKRELLQATAHKFFNDLNRLFIEHLVLHICRLTDNAETMGRKNLTVKFLMEHSDFTEAPETLEKLKRISADIDDFRELILPARNRFISHLDLEAIRLGHPLGAASMEKWKRFWLDLQDFLDLMHRHHIEPDGHFYLSGIGQMSDADLLITALRNAELFHAVLSDGESPHGHFARLTGLSLPVTFRTWWRLGRLRRQHFEPRKRRVG
jgi:hypothetical protein